MASLEEAMKGVREFEGGWVHDETDPGGETYVGITRRYFPEWYAWKIIDARKVNGVSDKVFLTEAVDSFYATNFWNRFRGNEISDVLQKIANELMLASVHCGVHQAVKFLQESLNILNKNETLYDDLSVDGGIGNNTLSTLNKFSTVLKKDIDVLRWTFEINYGAFLIKQMKESPVKEKYARGWLTRVMGGE
jgi:lysozyme family protein